MNILIACLWILLTFIPIINSWIKEKKRGLKFIGLISIISLSLIILVSLKENKDEEKSSKAAYKIDSLVKQVNEIHKSKQADVKRFSDFEKALFASFKIQRDSITNKPVQVYNTVISNAETVKIGGN